MLTMIAGRELSPHRLISYSFMQPLVMPLTYRPTLGYHLDIFIIIVNKFAAVDIKDSLM